MLVMFSLLDIDDRDRGWIEDIRRRYDPQHRFIDAHVTFVFPFTGTPLDHVVSHAAAVARETAPIYFRLTQVAAVKDPLGPLSHLFLLPTMGAEPMRALHDRLHSDLLAQHRHPTLTFDPHVTVGAFADHEEAERVAATLPPFDIAGGLKTLMVARFEGETLSDIHSPAFEG